MREPHPDPTPAPAPQEQPGSAQAPAPATPEIEAGADHLQAREDLRRERERAKGAARQAAFRERHKEAKSAAAAAEEEKTAGEAHAKEIERNTKTLKEALAPTFGLITDAVHALALRPSDPPFGDKRADRCATQWAAVFAPYLDADSLAYLLPILAVTITAGEAVSWAKEIRAAREAAARPGSGVYLVPQRPARPEQATSTDTETAGHA